MELEISTYIANKGHCPSIIALGRTYYPANHPLLTEEFLTWFYLDNPAGPATLVVAKEGDLWIGLVALIPVVLEYSGKLQRACYAVNVLTHPDHRTKNLFIKMIHYARDQLSKDDIWLLGHPNANAFPGWRRQKMAFRDPLRLYIAKFRLPFSFISIQRIYSLEMLRTIPASFFANLANRQDVHVKYSPEYIGWRFLNAPHREYNVAVVSYCGELLGLRVTRRFKGCVDLAVDFICPSTSTEGLLSSFQRPTLVMHSGAGVSGPAVNKACWRLPIKRQFPFFVSTWKQENSLDLNGITLAASDF